MSEPTDDGVVGPGLVPEHVNVGPFHCCQIPDSVRGGTVGRDNIPVILYEARVKIIDGMPTKQEKYAIMVPPKKDLGIVCAGCYKPGMTLWNNARCVSCRTFANHLDTKEDGSRKRQCISFGDDALEAVIDRSLGAVPTASGPTKVNLEGMHASDLLHALKGTLGLTAEHTDAILAEIPDGDLLYTLKRRHEEGLAGYLPHIEDRDILKHLDNIELSDIIKYVQARDPTLVFDKVVQGKDNDKASPGPYLFDSSFEKLEAEMRRRVAGTDTTMKRFYSEKRKRQGEPHFLDAPVVTWEYVCDAMYERSNSRG
jgi:hypothetical protein